MSPVKTIAVINQKGGVGKTTTVANLGAAIAAEGLDLCLVDLDPQGHLSLHYGIEPDGEMPTVYDVLTGERTVSEAATMISKNLCVLPSSIDLAAAESELTDIEGWEFKLRDGLDAARTLPHDYVLIDCPPSLGVLTLNALVAADAVVIPLQPHFLAMQGLAALLDTIQRVQKALNPKLYVAGVLFCMHESVTRLGRDVVAEIHSFLESARGEDVPWANARVFESVIRRNIRLAECPSYGQTIFDYDPQSRGAQDYRALMQEFLTLLDETAPAQNTDEIDPAPEDDEPEVEQQADEMAESMEPADANEVEPPVEAPAEIPEPISPIAPPVVTPDPHPDN